MYGSHQRLSFLFAHLGRAVKKWKSSCAEGINGSGKLLMVAEWNFLSAATDLADERPPQPFFYVEVGWDSDHDFC
ncbi:hypothetical protein OIU84_013586 [Salix udensis]|uniref:Uncharacterized protein n=1 Tax=Salix udensis TaxID=889485 RepID=A0AAD6NUW5_9ROSI|nr:hypothetical protein OIU84_013586 [Salix udensis]